MSGPVPSEQMSEPMRRYLQGLTEATGGPAFTIQLKRVSDTVVRIRMLGADNVWRESADIPLA